jgi:hypothetical protein
MVVHIDVIFVDGKRFVHARKVFPSELYKKAYGPYAASGPAHCAWLL